MPSLQRPPRPRAALLGFPPWRVHAQVTAAALGCTPGPPLPATGSCSAESVFPLTYRGATKASFSPPPSCRPDDHILIVHLIKDKLRHIKIFKILFEQQQQNDSNRAAIQSNRKELLRGVQNERPLKAEGSGNQEIGYCKITFLGDGRGSIRLPNSEAPSLWDLMPDDLI